jgi:RNA polymerase sigma factor (sigma-70 family)
MLGFIQDISGKIQKRRKKLTRMQQNVLMNQISSAGEFDDYKLQFNELYDSMALDLWRNFSGKFIPPLSKEDLEDVFQEAWVKLLESRKKYNMQSDVFNWAYSINRNLIIDRIRKIKRTNEISLDEFVEIEDNLLEYQIPDNEETIDNKFILQESVDIIMRELENIEDNTEKEILRRRIIYENTFEQISKDLNIPLTTVFKKTNLGLSKIKKKIKYIQNI